MIALVFALAAMQPTVGSNMRGGSVSFPDGVAPYMMPYINCIVAGMNADRRLPSGDPAVLRAIQSDALVHCKSVRQAVFDDTDRALKNVAAYRDDNRRRAMIENVLNQIDHMDDALVVPPAVPNVATPSNPHN